MKFWYVSQIHLKGEQLLEKLKKNSNLPLLNKDQIYTRGKPQIHIKA